MSDPSIPATLTVTFTDGTVQEYGFTEADTDDTQVASRIKHILEANCLLLEVDNSLTILPMQNIRSIEISPSPARLPDITVKNLRSLEA